MRLFIDTGSCVLGRLDDIGQGAGAALAEVIAAQMTIHRLTETGVEGFARDWAGDPAPATWLRDIARAPVSRAQ